jgi:hypothetical protein
MIPSLKFLILVMNNLLREMRPSDEERSENETGQKKVDDRHVDHHPVVVVHYSAEKNYANC